MLLKARHNFKTNDNIYINELEINGNIKEVFGLIAKNIFRFNDITKKEIEKLKRSLNLPEKYYGFHIRGGDKITESKLIPEIEYMNLLSNYSNNNIRDIFVSTDDYSIFENLVKNYGKKYNFHTLTTYKERGYDQYTFSQLDTENKRSNLIEFFASINILLGSEVCIGSYTSNPSVFLGAVIPNGKFIEINNKTQIITPSEKGEYIYDIVLQSMPDMLNPKLTASWEKGLDMVAKKEIKPEEFMTKLENYINSKFNKLVVKM